MCYIYSTLVLGVLFKWQVLGFKSDRGPGQADSAFHSEKG
ncbi:MAG: hypothetical protein FD143_3078, partial [Ignavibacteria bacterium]